MFKKKTRKESATESFKRVYSEIEDLLKDKKDFDLIRLEVKEKYLENDILEIKIELNQKKKEVSFN